MSDGEIVPTGFGVAGHRQKLLWVAAAADVASKRRALAVNSLEPSVHTEAPTPSLLAQLIEES